jgi:hypothetical protein
MQIISTIAWIAVIVSFFFAWHRTRELKNFISYVYLAAGIAFSACFLLALVGMRFNGIVFIIEAFIFLAAIISTIILASIAAKKLFPVLFIIALTPPLLHRAMLGFSDSIPFDISALINHYFFLTFPVFAILAIVSAALMNPSLDGTAMSDRAASSGSWLKYLLYGIGCIVMAFIGWGLGHSQNNPKLAGSGVILLAIGVIYLIVAVYKLLKKAA